MSSEERIDRLTERHEALTQTVELLAIETQELRAAISQDAENIRTLARLTTNLTYQDTSGTINIGGTGRSEIQRLVSNMLEPHLTSALMAQAVAENILRALREAGYVVVPVVPTRAMLGEAWEDALGEDAAAVWETMIKVHEDSIGNSSNGNG